jgi:SAM-dependent methyltransferase
MLITKIGYAFKVLNERGVGFFWTYFVESVCFDLRFGTKTSSRVTKDEQTINSTDEDADNGLLYVASFTSVTSKTVALAREIVGPKRFDQTQFVDLGCGKGKALLVYAKEFGDGKSAPALGIEYDPDLTELAVNNVERCYFAKDRVKIINDSAVNVLNHVTQDCLIIYLYNSFQGETLLATLNVLKNTPHVLIYVDPAEREVLSNYNYIIHKENRGRYNADTWLVASSGV